MELWRRKDETATAYREMLLQHNWEWFCSFEIPLERLQKLSSGEWRSVGKCKADYSKAEDLLKKWRIKMGTQQHILFCYMGVYNTTPQPHVHLLAWGKPNKSGQTLLDLNHKEWEKGWSGLTHRNAVIEPIYDREGVVSYISGKNLPWDRSELIQPYQKRLLGKALIR